MAPSQTQSKQQPKEQARSPGMREFRTRMDIPRERRERLQGALNARLADALDLFSQTKQAHWNVKGPNFHQLHLLFDTLAEIVEDHADLFAERVTALGGTAQGTVRNAAEASSLPEFPDDLNEDMAFVEALADRYATYGSALRSDVDAAEDMGDKATSDIFVEASRAADKALYLLEAHLQGGESRDRGSAKRSS